MARIKRQYSSEDHSANMATFKRLQAAGEAIPDDLYYWFMSVWTDETYLSDAQATGMYTYLINHNVIASREASSAAQFPEWTPEEIADHDRWYTQRKADL